MLRVSAVTNLELDAHLRDYGPIRPQSGRSDGFMASFRLFGSLGILNTFTCTQGTYILTGMATRYYSRLVNGSGIILVTLRDLGVLL